LDEYNKSIVKRTIVELDLVGYSDIARYLEEHLGANAVMQLNRQVQSFVDEGLRTVKIEPGDAVNSKAGDNAIVVFEHVVEAHCFAEVFHRITEQYNVGKTEISAERHFRLGISTGEIAIDGNEIAGTTIINSCRLEAGGNKGHILICSDTYAELPAEYRSSYVGPEILTDKRGEEHTVYRYIVVKNEAIIKQEQPFSFLPSAIRENVLQNKKIYTLAAYSLLAVTAWIGVYFLTEPMRRTTAISASTTAFLSGIKSGDYTGAWSHLSRTSQHGYQLTDFIRDHTPPPKISDFTIVQLTHDKRDRTKAFARISSSSKIYGQKKLDLELNKEEGEWRIVLRRNTVSSASTRQRKKSGGFRDFINSIFK
jgi:class 3 adenylate cyclase